MTEQVRLFAVERFSSFIAPFFLKAVPGSFSHFPNLLGNFPHLANRGVPPKVVFSNCVRPAYSDPTYTYIHTTSVMRIMTLQREQLFFLIAILTVFYQDSLVQLCKKNKGLQSSRE